MKIVGIPEDPTANKDHIAQPEDTKDIIYNFMGKELSIDNPRCSIAGSSYGPLSIHARNSETM